jgi:hypothetical protein
MTNVEIERIAKESIETNDPEKFHEQLVKFQLADAIPVLRAIVQAQNGDAFLHKYLDVHNEVCYFVWHMSTTKVGDFMNEIAP